MMETKNFGGEQIAVAKPCGPWRMKCYDGALIKQQYLLSKCIGDGLTAVVYEAVDTFTCQPVAVKVLNRHQVNLNSKMTPRRLIRHVTIDLLSYRWKVCCSQTTSRERSSTWPC